MNISETKDALLDFIACDIPAFMWGAPGVGKSDSVRQVGAHLGMPVVDFRAILRDPVDLRGLPMVDAAAGATKWARPSDLPFIGNDGPDDAILFLDELNTAPASMQAACYGLVLDRRIGDHVLKPGVRVIAAGNRQSDRGATQKMPSPLANRMAHINVHCDPAEWSAWAVGEGGLDPLVSAFIRYRPGLLHAMPGTKVDDTNVAIPDNAVSFPTPRAWASVSKLVSRPNAGRTLVERARALVGEAAGEFAAFYQTWSQLEPIDVILSNPTTARVPTNPGALFALTGALAHFATRKNFDDVMTYAARLGVTYELLVMRDTVARHPDLRESRTFIEWKVAHSQYEI